LKEACGGLQKLMGVIFVRQDIGWGSSALESNAGINLKQVVGQRNDARKHWGYCIVGANLEIGGFGFLHFSIILEMPAANEGKGS
jgi:hypothetical protein